MLLAFAEFDEQAQEVCKLYQLWGIRRPLWVYVDDLEWRFEGDDLLLEFSLPTGSYATVVLAFVLQDVDRLTLKDNRLEIPRIEKSLNQ
ncbi:MAG: tRNA pseudouridine(13) synthase TruD [Candidatus Peribacteria bacterium]|nr:tRNA pseudouridine(13) synthase TruD [Candidatus Peribacteria bacterium]